MFSCHSNNKRHLNNENIIPWCIVAFDSVNRSPLQRIEMLKDFGFDKYAYDWRDHHLDDMLEEIQLARENSIEVVSVWLWLNAERDSLGQLSMSNQRMFKNLKESKLETTLWLSFNNNFFEGLDHAEALKRGIDLVKFINEKAAAINCTVALYNHTGWFGNPYNQVEIIKALPQFNLKIVYNFHHGHEHIDTFGEIADVMLPYLVNVNLNGMKSGGPKILPVGQGDHEGEMIQVLLDKGYNGPWGVLGHVENADVKFVLEQNRNGLNLLFN